MSKFTSEQLVEEFFQNKRDLEELTFRNKEILHELSEITGGQEAVISNHKLSLVERKGSISYAKVVAEHLPAVDLEEYRGAPTEYWTLK